MMIKDFDKKAAGWDQQMYRVERARSIAEKILHKVHLADDANVLDFGCGTGLLGFHFLDRIRTVTFADTSPGMLDQVRAKAAERGGSRVRTLLLPEPLPGLFDLIVSLMVLHHIEDHGQTIRQLAQQVKPLGHLCLCDLDQEDGSFHTEETVPHNGFPRSEIEGLLREQGMQVVSSGTGFVNRKKIGEKEMEFPVFLIIGRKPAEAGRAEVI